MHGHRESLLAMVVHCSGGGPRSCSLGGEQGDRCCALTWCSFIYSPSDNRRGWRCRPYRRGPQTSRDEGWPGLPATRAQPHVRPRRVPASLLCPAHTCDASGSCEPGGRRRESRGHEHTQCEAWARRLRSPPRPPALGAPAAGPPALYPVLLLCSWVTGRVQVSVGFSSLLAPCLPA